MMQTQERRATMRPPAPDGRDRTAGPSTPSTGGLGVGGGVLVGLLALACPLLCLGPVLLVGLASTGLARALGGAAWPLIAAAVLVVLVLGVWGVCVLRLRGTRGTGDCCAPTRPAPLRKVHDESAR